MLVYTDSGKRRFDLHPVVPKRRPIWEFWVLLRGNITINGQKRELPATRAQPTLWAFPPYFVFGCQGAGETERAVFDFSTVPSELEHQLGVAAYFEVALAPEDCRRIRELAKRSRASIIQPTQLSTLLQNSILHELSLIALRDVKLIPLTRHELAQQKTEQALGWYASRLDENPTLSDAATFVHVSPAHLRRLFHEARGESPKAAFTRIRKEKIEQLMNETSLTMEQISEQVGLSSASTLTHFANKHFGCSPKELRKQVRRHYPRGSEPAPAVLS